MSRVANCSTMNLLRLLFVTFLGMFASNLSVSAKENKENEAQKVSTENALKQYVVTFHDEITAVDFDDTSKWITDNRGEIVESINENFAKLIIAKMDPSIRIF